MKLTNKEHIQLICLPYAGGSYYSFQSLNDYWSENIVPFTIAYPGRGDRLLVPLIKDMESLVNDCWEQIRSILKPPYALLGHSLGSSLAYLLTHKIMEEGKTLPVHLFLSGADSPRIKREDAPRYLLPKSEFKKKLKSYGGIADEILNNEDAFNFFEPIIRADFQVVENWEYTPKPKLNLPATIITGTEEEMKVVDIQLWQEEFSEKLSFKQLKGNHFFLFQQASEFTAIVCNDLKSSLEKKLQNLDLV